MGTERHRLARSGAEVAERQRELLHALRTAADTLTACVGRIEELIERVDRQMIAEPPAPARRPARVSFGGGSSVIGSGDPRATTDSPRGMTDSLRGMAERPRGSEERRRGDRRAGIEERRMESEREIPRYTERPAPGTPALMAATEMAHLGYSREEIAERLRARWGDRAAAILREALD